MILWDVEEGVPIETLEGHAGVTETHAFSPDGRTLYTAGNDGRVIVWDVAGDRRLGRPFPRGLRGWEPGHDYPPAFALSPDGRALAVARLDGRVELIDAETLRRTGELRGRPRQGGGGDRLLGRWTAAGGGGRGWRRRGLGRRVGRAGRRAPSRPPGPSERPTREPSRRSPSARAICSPRRRWGARCGSGTSAGASCFDRRCACLASVHGLAFSPDGSQLAIPFGADSDEGPNGVEILDVGSGERVARLSPDGEVRSVAFSPDGSLLAGGMVDGGALLWASDGWGPVGGLLARLTASTLEVEFSPDGHTLATSHSDHSVALWDVASQEPIGPPLGTTVDQGDDAGVTARFTPDGAHLFVLYTGEGRASNLGRAIRWEVDPELWLQRACASPAAASRPSSGKRSCPSRTTCRPAPRADDKARRLVRGAAGMHRRSGARLDHALARPFDTERIPPCRRLLAVNRHRASPHLRPGFGPKPRESHEEAIRSHRRDRRGRRPRHDAAVGPRRRGRRGLLEGQASCPVLDDLPRSRRRSKAEGGAQPLPLRGAPSAVVRDEGGEAVGAFSLSWRHWGAPKTRGKGKACSSLSGPSPNGCASVTFILTKLRYKASCQQRMYTKVRFQVQGDTDFAHRYGGCS